MLLVLVLCSCSLTRTTENDDHCRLCNNKPLPNEGRFETEEDNSNDSAKDGGGNHIAAAVTPPRPAEVEALQQQRRSFSSMPKNSARTGVVSVRNNY